MAGCARRWTGWGLAVVLAQTALPAAALHSGMVDTFTAGDDGGWSAGAAALFPPQVIAGGGPAGAGDGYLQARAAGGSGPSSRLVLIAGPQWSGDYAAAGIDRITVDAINLGATDLALRLWLAGTTGATALSADAVLLNAGSGWTRWRSRWPRRRSPATRQRCCRGCESCG